MKNLKVIKLKNGATLLYIKKENDPFASMTYGFRVGSNDETDDTRGIAHFIEHMCFNGTSKYSPDEINDLPQLYGGDINASTSKTSTQYTLQVLKEYLNEGLELINDVTFFPLFPEKAIKKEKNIILQELQDCEDEPWNSLFDLTYSAFENSNIKHDIIGYKKNIKSFNRNMILDFYNRFYIPSNLIVSICGDFDEQELIDKLNSLIPDIDRKFEDRDNEDLTAKTRMVVKYKEGLTQIRLAKYYIFKNKDIHAINFMGNILGSGINSRLMKELREEQGLAYNVGAMIDQIDEENSLFIIYLSYSDENKTEHICNEIDRIINELAEDVTDLELLKIKSCEKGDYFRQNESSMGLALLASDSYLNKDFTTLEDDYIDKVNAITKEDVKNVINKYFLKEQSFVAILKPKKKNRKRPV